MFIKISGELEDIFRRLKKTTGAYEYVVIENAFIALDRAVKGRIEDNKKELAIYNPETKEFEIVNLPILDKITQMS